MFLLPVTVVGTDGGIQWGVEDMAGLVAHRTNIFVQEIFGVGQVLPEKGSSQRYILHYEVVYRKYYIWTYKNAKKLSFWIVSTKNPKELWRGVFSLASIYHLSHDSKFFFGITLLLCRSGPASFSNLWRMCVSQSNTWWFLQIAFFYVRSFQLDWY